MSAQVAAEEFQLRYLNAFKKDRRMFSDDIFAILNGMFSDCDFFNSNRALRGPKDLDEAQLLEACKTAYGKLQALRS